MEQKSSMRDFARYTILSVLGTLGVSCYILADTFFVSKGVGTDPCELTLGVMTWIIIS